MERKLENWLTAYGDWTIPRSEAQESIIIATGLFTVASVLKRKVWFPRELLGSYVLFPNLYVIVVGPQGIVKKSTTMDYAQELLTTVPGVNLASEAMSQSALHGKLGEVPDHSLSIVSDEFATFINVSKAEMFDTLTALYGGRMKHDLETRARGKESIEKPCVNLLAATTPVAISALMPEHVIGGGFASRALFIYETAPRRKKMFYDDIDYTEIDDLKLRLSHDLNVMASLEGQFTLENDSLQHEIEEWYQSIESPTETHMEGYYNRKHTHMLKLAMLLSVCESDSLIITRVHFRGAVALLKGWEEKMPRAFVGAGRNVLARSAEDILEFVSSFNKPVPKSEIMRRYHHSFPSLSDFEDALRWLISMERIEPVNSNNGIAFREATQQASLRVVEGNQQPDSEHHKHPSPD